MGIGVLDIPLSDISLKLDHVGGEAFPFPSDLHPITIALTGSGNVPGHCCLCIATLLKFAPQCSTFIRI